MLPIATHPIICSVVHAVVLAIGQGTTVNGIYCLTVRTHFDVVVIIKTKAHMVG